MEYKNIDKEIYHFPEISKRLKPMNWAWICTILGGVSGYYYITTPSLGVVFSSLLLGMLIIGLFSFLTMACYYIFGDCRTPFYKPKKAMLEREYYFYSSCDKPALCEALENHDKDKLGNIKRSSIPQLVLVRYSDISSEIMYSQIQETMGNRRKPVTQIVFDDINERA